MPPCYTSGKRCKENSSPYLHPNLHHNVRNSKPRALTAHNLHPRGDGERNHRGLFFHVLNKLSRWKDLLLLFFFWGGTKGESRKAVGRAKMALQSLYPRPRLFEFGLRALFVKGIHKIRPRARVSCILNRFARTKPLLHPLRMKITTKREFADKRISRTCNMEICICNLYFEDIKFAETALKILFLQYIIVWNGNIMPTCVKWTKYNFKFNFVYFLSTFYFLHDFANIQKNVKILFCY